MMKKRIIPALCVALGFAMIFCGCDKKESATKTDNSTNEQTADETQEGDGTDDSSAATDDNQQKSGGIEDYEEPDEAYFEEDDNSEETYALYEGFLGIGEAKAVKAIVADNVALGSDDWDMSYTGKQFTLNEIGQLLKDNNGIISKLPTISYLYFPSIGYNDLLAVKYTNVGIEGEDGDGSTTVMIFANRDGQLYLTHSYNTWSRCDGELSDIGLLYSSGASGAGEYSVEYGCFLEDGTYQQLYSVASLFDVWIGMDIDQEAFDQAYGTDSDEGYTYMVAQVMTMDDKTCYSYDFQEGHEATEQDEEFLKLTTEKGIDWLSNAEMETITAQRLESFGLDSDFMQVEDGNWEEL